MPGGQRIQVEVSDSFLKQILGLRFRRSGAMLFPFSKPVKKDVDMMFVRLPLHLYFLNGDGVVVETGTARPWTFYTPSTEYRLLLESFNALDIAPGDRVEILG